jgi:hypothetical protein
VSAIRKGGAQLPALPVQKKGDAYLHVGDPHILEAAKMAGMTHVPVAIQT